MSVETCKVKNKNGTVKIIMVKDLPQYLAMGWVKVEENFLFKEFKEIK